MSKKSQNDPNTRTDKKPKDQTSTDSKRDKEKDDDVPPRDVHRGTTDADETLDREGYQAFD